MDAISTLSDVGRLEFAIAQVELLNDEFALLTLAKIVNQEIIDVIQDKMRAAKYSRKIIDSTYLDRIAINSDGEADIYLKSDYKTESGFDISEGRETGIRRHEIEALDEDGYLSFLLNGKRMFRKKVTHPGIVGSFIIQDTINQKAETVQKRYHTEEEEWALSFFEDTSLMS